MITRFVAYSEKCRKYMFSGGSAQSITILHRGGYQNSLQYYMGGSLRTPNLYMCITYNGRPLMCIARPLCNVRGELKAICLPEPRAPNRLRFSKNLRFSEFSSIFEADYEHFYTWKIEKSQNDRSSPSFYNVYVTK